MLAQLSRIARWAIVAAAAVGVMLVGAANSGAAVEPNTTIHDYNIYDDNADFWFRSDVAGATFECRLDDAAFETCVSPVNYRGLPEGTHRFEVRAVDSEGVVDSSPANLTFTSTPQPPPPPPAPPNDNWYGAESISGTSGSVEGTNVNATTQWDEPYNPDGAEHTVWYEWTAGRNATVTFSVVGDGFTPRVSIYSGTVAQYAPLVNSGVGEASVTTYVRAQYRVSVDGVAGGSGPFTLSWAYENTGPANDYFAEAQPLEGESGSLTASTVGATTELNEPRHDGSAGENTAGHSIWYRWTAPAAGTAIFTTEGSSFDTDLAAYTGSAVDSLTIRGWYEPDLNPWTTWSRLELRVEPGQVYSIVVDGQDGATGDVQLNWRMALDTGDTELPTVEMWSPEPGANVDGLVTFMADAYDNDSIDRVMYFIEPNGHTGLPWLVGEAREWPYAVELDTNVLEPGLYSVHARAVDVSGNSASYGFDITVGGVPPPTLIVPENLTVEATRPTGALVRFNARATDFEGDPLPVTCNPRSGTIFPLGPTTVTCSASDSFGNSTAKSFTVTVVDTTPPTVTTPTELVANAVSPGGSPLEFTATATDRVDREIVPSCTPTSGSTFAVGDTTVTCSATDASGNTSTASFNVHVKGGDEQLADLRGYVGSLALEKNFADRLRAQIADIRKHLAQGDTNAVCGGLADLVAEAEKESGKRLTPEQAERIVADSMRIRAVVGC